MEIDPPAVVDQQTINIMEAYQQRVVDEMNELDAKRDKLRAFIGGDVYRTLANMEQSRLNRQLEAMTLYSSILSERVAAFQNIL